MFTDPINAPAVETPSARPATLPATAPATPSGEAAPAGASAPPGLMGESGASCDSLMPKVRGGRSNPSAREVASWRQAVLNAVPPADMQSVIRKLIELAAAGSLPAARLLLGYAIGKP